VFGMGTGVAPAL